MSSKPGYRFSWNATKLAQVKRNTIGEMINFGFKIAAEAQHGAPVDTGALVNSVRTTTNNTDQVLILAGGSFSGKSVPYAKRREYENKKHPSKRFYMKNAFAWGEQNYQKYFKGVTK